MQHELDRSLAYVLHLGLQIDDSRGGHLLREKVDRIGRDLSLKIHQHDASHEARAEPGLLDEPAKHLGLSTNEVLVGWCG